jgi:hypothetical protein
MREDNNKKMLLIPRVNSESVPNEFVESDSQFEKQDEQRI